MNNQQRKSKVFISHAIFLAYSPFNVADSRSAVVAYVRARADVVRKI